MSGRRPSRLRISMIILPVVLIAACSIAATLDAPVFSFVQLIPFGDRLAHFLLFGSATLGILLALPRGKKTAVLGMAAMLGIVLVEETLQLAFSTRTFSYADLFAGLGGVVLFGGLTFLIRSRKRGESTARCGK